MLSADLQAGYYHMEIHEEDQEYVGFELDGEYYVFCALPFGLSFAPYAFQLLTRQVVRSWRARGIKVVHYLDDFLWLAPSAHAGRQLAHVVRHDLEILGFIISEPKSHLEPTQCLVHLGFTVDLVRMVF